MNYKLMKTQVCDSSWHDRGMRKVGEYISYGTIDTVYTTPNINEAFITAAEYHRELLSFSSEFWNYCMKDPSSCNGCKVKVVEG